ncbi:MAG: phospho-sugar mutase, partial [Actinomycetota bacterium]
ELVDSFSGRLTFGTAGLRGALGPGPNRMNRMVVRQTAAGLAAFVREQSGRVIVIGFDARHQSDVFARESAAVFAGAGLRVMILPRALPTPVLAHAVLSLGCDAGVMVTASHNPAVDNGYKVYLGDGAQIAAPVDQQISDHITRVAAGPLSAITLCDEWETLGEEVLVRYVARAASLVRQRSLRPARVVYTPMHGVGGTVFNAVLSAAGLPEPIMVVEQSEPDPDFPTVAFPNPEEPGALDLALATAQRCDADLLIAHDPDADRCAVGLRVQDAEGTGPKWRILTGDEVGSLLAWSLTRADVCEPSDVFAQSIVSGTMLRSIAQTAGLGHVQTLTGFKWISRVPNLRFGYEEALGYCVDPGYVRDKDGITAGLLVIAMAGRLLDEGRTLADVLDDLEVEHGIHATTQISRRFATTAHIGALIDGLRTDPPTVMAGIKVQGVDDLACGVDGLPPTEGLRFVLDGGGRIIVRPSGTEPKIKCYLQVVERVAGGLDGLAAARASARQRLDLIAADVEVRLSRPVG